MAAEKDYHTLYIVVAPDYQNHLVFWSHDKSEAHEWAEKIAKQINPDAVPRYDHQWCHNIDDKKAFLHIFECTKWSILIETRASLEVKDFGILDVPTGENFED